MSAQPKSPRQRLSRDERRLQIAEAALRIIARDGVHGFKTSTIAREVGVAEGTLFRHFANKDEIIVAAVDLMTVQFAGNFPEGADDPVQRLGQLYRGRLALLLEHPGLMRILFSDELARAGSLESAARVNTLLVGSVQFIIDCLRQADEAGRLKSGLSVEAAFMLIHGTALAHIFSRNRLESLLHVETDPDKVWATLKSVIIDPDPD